MTAPQEAVRSCAWACLLGLCLGLWAAVLAPLGKRHPWLRDALVTMGGFWCWLYLSFAVCAGAVRLYHLAGLGIGQAILRRVLGRQIEKIMICAFHQIRRAMQGLFQPLCRFFKKYYEKLKITFASGGKSVTIKWTNRRCFDEDPEERINV